MGEDTWSFQNALKHVLRQDPDIILVGEMRDLETISVALTAAETGHLVFATLHTQDAAQTIDRVIDVFPPHQQQQVRVQLAGALQGVVCQTLARTADGQGRVVATEVLVATPAIRNLIREGKTHQIYSAMQAGAKHGMHTMDQHLADLVQARAGSPTRPASRSATTSRTSTGSPAEAERRRNGSDADLRVLGPRPAPGKIVSGKLEAESQARSPHKLKSMGYAPVSINEAKAGHEEGDQASRASASKVKLKDLAVMSRQFATMINSGLSLLRALTILAEQTENKELRRVLGEVRNDVETGAVAVQRAWPSTPRSSRR